MINRVKLILENYMINAEKNRLLIALSGGADSVCLLHILWRLMLEYNLELEALHLNHCLRGAESDRDEGFARSFCEKLNIPITVSRADVKTLTEQSGESLEECARRVRYAFFEEEAEAKNALVLTAHNQDDSAETVLLNLIRGTGLRGLCGIPPARGIYLRPLLSSSRLEIENYCRENNLAYMTDSSNNSDDFTRNRIRHIIIPRLKDENPRFSHITAEMARLLKEDADLLDGLAKEALESLGRAEGFDRESFLTLHPAISGRVLLLTLRNAGLRVSRDTVSALTGMIAAGEGVRALSAEISFVSGAKSFRLIRKEEPQAYFIKELEADELLKSGSAEIYSGKIVSFWAANKEISEILPEILKKGFTCAIDCDKIDKIISIRGRLPGDRLRLPGRGCDKTLKNIFQEAGISPADRTKLAVVSDSRGVIAAEGIGVSERAAISPLTGRALILHFPEGRNG